MHHRGFRPFSRFFFFFLPNRFLPLDINDKDLFFFLLPLAFQEPCAIWLERLAQQPHWKQHRFRKNVQYGGGGVDWVDFRSASEKKVKL